MQALCLDAGLSAGEFNETFQKVNTATLEWEHFAKESAVPAALAGEVEQRLQKMRREVLGNGSK